MNNPPVELFYETCIRKTVNETGNLLGTPIDVAYSLFDRSFYVCTQASTASAGIPGSCSAGSTSHASGVTLA